MWCRALASVLLVTACWMQAATATTGNPGVLELTHEGALALALEQAPTLAIAEARIREARSRMEAASLWPFNPELSGAAGPRDAPEGSVTDWSVELSQRLELGGQRAHRRNAAAAGIEAASARSADARRLLGGEVSRAFASALYWTRRVRLAHDNARLTEEVLRIASERHKLGDIGGLDEAVAELALLRARTEIVRNEVSLESSTAQLKALLGVPAETRVACRGDLSEIAALSTDQPDSSARPDLEALRAEMRQAEAEAALGRSKRIPDLSLGAIYEREESTDIVKGALTLSLPLFDRGQGETAMAEARRERLRRDLLAESRSAEIEAASRLEVSRKLTEAARRFDEEGLGALERAERLARGSYEAGAIPLAELLTLRRELVEAQRDYTDLLFAAASARIDLATSTGAIR